MRDSQRVLLLLFLCLTFYLPALGNRDLWGTVETEYAQVARETLQSTSWEGWLIPHFNGSVYSEKPPLYFWLIALASLPVGDVTEFTARLPSALTALGTVILLYLLGKTMYDERVGFLASLTLLSSPEFFRSACMVRIDMPVAFFFTLSVTGFYMGLASSRRLFFLLGWFSAALCLLTKGPLYPLIIVLTLSLYLASRSELHRLKEALTPLDAMVFFATICSWLIPVYLEEETYLKNLLNLGRWYLEGSEYHAESFYFYLPQFLAGMAPWSIFLPVALYLYYSNKNKENGEKENKGGITLPPLWLLVGLVIFSIITTKHGRYILFLYPAGALIVAQIWNIYWLKSPSSWPWKKSVAMLTIASLLGVEVALFIGGCLPYPFLNLFLVDTGVLIAIYLAYRALQIRLLFGSVFLTLTISQGIYYQFLLPLKNDIHSEKPLCQKLLNVMEPGTKWAAFRVYRPAFTYYTKTFPTNILQEERLKAFLSSREKVYCLLAEEDYRRLKLPAFKLAEFLNPKENHPPYILVSNKQ